jgi:hypothetical protein
MSATKKLRESMRNSLNNMIQRYNIDIFNTVYEASLISDDVLEIERDDLPSYKIYKYQDCFTFLLKTNKHFFIVCINKSRRVVLNLLISTELDNFYINEYNIKDVNDIVEYHRNLLNQNFDNSEKFEYIFNNYKDFTVNIKPSSFIEYYPPK